MRPVVDIVRLAHNADLPRPAYETAGAAGMDLRAHQMRTEDERYDIHNTAARFQALESKLSHLEGLMLQKVREKRASATPAALTVALPASSSRSRSPTPWHSKDSLDA